MINSTLDLLSSWFTPTSLFILVNLVIGTIAITSHLNTPKKPHNQQHLQDQEHQFFENSMHPLTTAPSIIDRVKSINLSFYKFDSPSSQEYIHHTQPTQPEPEPWLARAPSFFGRVSSFNLSSFYRSNSSTSHDNTQLEDEIDEPVHIEEVKSCMPEPDSKKAVHDTHQTQPQLSRAPSFLQRVSSFNFSSFYRSNSGTSQDYTRVEDEVVEPGHIEEVKRSLAESSETKKIVNEKMKKSASEKNSCVGHFENEEREDVVEKRRPHTTRLEKSVSIGDEEINSKADDFINKFKQQLKLQRLDSLLRYKERGSAK